MRLDTFSAELDNVTAAMLAAGAPLPDAPPGPYTRQLCGVLAWMQGVRDNVPLDDVNPDGSVLNSLARLRQTIRLQREALGLVANMLALRPYTPDMAEALPWLATHRMRLDAADILVQLEEGD